MILAPRTLLSLLVLVTRASASGSDNTSFNWSTRPVAAPPTSPPELLSRVPLINCSASGLATTHSDRIFQGSFGCAADNLRDARDLGVKLREKAATVDKRVIVKELNEQAEGFITQGYKTFEVNLAKKEPGYFSEQKNHDFHLAISKSLGESTVQKFETAAATMISGFFAKNNHDIMSFVKVAKETKAFYLLKILQSCHAVWPDSEQFHQFQALSFESDWYDESLWRTHPMNWSKNLRAICMADNHSLFETLQSENHLIFDRNDMLNLIVEHDALNICKHLQFSSEDLETKFKVLAESGSFELLLPLLKSSKESRNLENYPLPKRLPRDPKSFKLLFKHGYRFLPVSHFLEIACEDNRPDVIKYFYDLDDTLFPDERCLEIAASNGRSNILNWAKDRGVPITDKVLLAAILNGYFGIFQQFGENRKNSCNGQIMSNAAASKDNLIAANYIYNAFGTVPESGALCNASFDMLLWVNSIKPKRINGKLARGANLTNLNWLWLRFNGLFDDDLKNIIFQECLGREKMEWIVNNWKMKPVNFKFAASVGDVEGMEWARKEFGLTPYSEDAMKAAKNGHLNAIKWIYEVNSPRICQSVARYAAKKGHWEVFEYIDSFTNARLMFTYFSQLDLTRAIRTGYLVAVRKALKCRFDHLLIKEPLVGYLKLAVEFDQPEIYLYIFQRYTCRRPHYNLKTQPIENHLQLAFDLGNFQIFKQLVRYFPDCCEQVKTKSANAHNHHLKQWLSDEIRRGKVYSAARRPSLPYYEYEPTQLDKTPPSEVPLIFGAFGIAVSVIIFAIIFHEGR